MRLVQCVSGGKRRTLCCVPNSFFSNSGNNISSKTQNAMWMGTSKRYIRDDNFFRKHGQKSPEKPLKNVI